MTSLAMVIAAAANPITVSANWGSNIGAAPSNITSTAETLMVPSGNAGVIKFNYTDTTGGALQYKKNAGAFTNVGASGSTVSGWANSDTLTLRDAAPSGAGVMSVTLLDNAFASTIGTWTATAS